MAGASDPKAAARRRTVTFSVLGVLLVAALGVRWYLDRESGTEYSEAPVETRGVWRTSAPRYEDRAIEVSAGTVVLHRGAAGPLAGRLTVARESVFEGDRVFRLEYTTEEGPNNLEMVMRPGGTMHLRNQPEVVWSAGDAPATPTTVPAIELPPVPVPVSEPGGGIPWLTVLLVVAGGALVLLLLRARGDASEEASPGWGAAPDLVRGVWTTMDDRYAGHSIRIAPGYAFSQFGPGDIRIGGTITEASERREDGARVISLELAGRDGDDRLEMIIDQSGHMRLRQGPKSVWVKR